MNNKILLFTDENGISIDSTSMQDLRRYLNESIIGTDFGLTYVTMAMEWTKKVNPEYIGYVFLLNAAEQQIQTALFSCPNLEGIYSLYYEGTNQWNHEVFEVDEGEVINNSEHSGLPRLDFLRHSEKVDGDIPLPIADNLIDSSLETIPSKNINSYILNDPIPEKEQMHDDIKENHFNQPLEEDLQDTNDTNHYKEDLQTSKLSTEEINEKPKDDVNYKRTRTIQKQLFSRQEWQSHKTIGIWSPIHQTGVTTFVINFALYLAKHRIYTGVLEGLTSNHILKYWLNRYTKIPDGWVSYARVIHEEIEPNLANWTYGNVLFLPLNDGDIDQEWTSDTLESYIKMPSLLDIILVDLPTGEMNKHTVDSLMYLSELWILVDDSFHEIIAWKEYIQQLNEITNIPIRLIFNKKYEFSQVKRLEKELDYPLITSIPALHEEVKRNYYQTKPLVYIDSVYEELHPGFNQLKEYLFGNEVLYSKQLPNVQVPNFLSKVKNKLKKYFMDSY